MDFLWSENSMIKISEEIKKLYIEDSTPIELEVRFKDNAFPTINGSDVLSEQMTLHESICEEEQLKFGGCNASSFELTVFNLNSGIKGYEIEPVLITNKTEIPLGVFYVETIEKYAGKDYNKLTAYDKMRYFDVDVKDWYESLTFPISLKNFRDSLCEHVGVKQNDATLIADNIMLTKELDSSNGINGLSLMKQICEISGVFGRMDRYGKFDYLSIEPSTLLPADNLYPDDKLFPVGGSAESENTLNISTSIMYEHPLIEDFFTANIDGVILVDSEGAEYITENKENPYYIRDNFAITGQTHDTLTNLAQSLTAKINNISYRPINSSKIKGQPYVECGDFIIGEVNGYGFEAYVFQRDLTGIKALRDSYISKGKEILENDMNGVTATLQKLNNSIGKTKVLIEKTEKGLRGEISQSLEESKQYTNNSASDTLNSANEYAQEVANEALNTATDNTNEKLKSYYTKTEADTKLEATANGFSAEITSTQKVLKEYADETASQAKQEAISSANETTENKLKEYSTTTEMQSAISATAESISQEVSKSITETKSYADSAASVAEENAKSDTSNRLKEYSTTKQMNSAISQSAETLSANLSKSITETKSYADSVASTAKENAVNSANSYTDNSLTSYVTEKELTNTISITSEGFNAEIKKQVSETKSYADSVASTAKENAVNSANSYTDNSLGNYTTNEVFQNTIDATNNKISTEVSRAKSEEEKLSSKITETAETIKTEVSQTYETINNADSRQKIIQSSIEQASSQIVLKVDANGKIVQVALTGDITKGTEFKVNADNIGLSANDVINLLANGEINLTSKNISIISDNFSVTKDGKMTCKDANITGTFVTSDAFWMWSKYLNKAIPILRGEQDTEKYQLRFRDLKNSTIMIVESNSQVGDGIAVKFYLDIDFRLDATFTNNITVKGTTTLASSPVISSDEDIKKDISMLDNQKSSDFIYSLKPVRYKYIDNESNRYHHGLIAREVKESMGNDDWGVYCDANINTGKNGGKGIRYEELIADLIATVQSQNERIKALESQIGGNS